MKFDGKIKIFYDGTNVEKYCQLPYICGTTTNTSFMKQSGNTNYPLFYQSNEQHLRGLPISFQIYEEHFSEAFRDAKAISNYGSNTYVKVPVIDTTGALNDVLIRRLLASGMKVNVTAVYTEEQISDIYGVIKEYSSPIIVSIFCGRISDTGRDPVPIVKYAVDLFKHKTNVEILWAGTKSVLSIQEAIDAGCQIITVPDAILDRIHRVDMDLTEMSLDTVRSFKKDAIFAKIVV